MILIWKALLALLIYTTMIIMVFNHKANSQSKTTLIIAPPSLSFIPKKNFSWLAQTPPSLQPSDLSEVPDSQRSLLRALQVANSLEEPYLKATLLSDIAIKYFNLGKSDQAKEILEQSLEVARTIEDILNKVNIMEAIALNYNQIGQKTTAQELLSETLEIVNSIEDKSLQAGLLSKIALKYAELGEQTSEETLLSQSEEIREQTSADFPFQPSPLKGTFTLGLGTETGTKSKANLTSLLQLEQQWETDYFSLDIDFKTDFDSSRSRDKYRTRINFFGLYAHHFDETWQLFALTRFERNIKDAIFYDVEPLVGAALNVFRQGTERTLDIGVGLGGRYQDAEGKVDKTDIPTLGLVLIYKDVFFEWLEFDQQLIVSLPVNDTVNWRLGSLTDFSVSLGEKWSFTTRIRYIYRGDPPERKAFDNFNLTTGVSYEF